MAFKKFLLSAAAMSLSGGAQAAAYNGSYTISGITGTPTSFAGTFSLMFDPTLSYNDLAPTAFNSMVGSATFNGSNTAVDIFKGANATIAGGSDYLFGAFNAAPGDTNNLLGSGTTDFRVRFLLDAANNLVSARGGYVLGGPIVTFDTTLDGSRATFVISQVAVPEPASWALMIAGFGIVGGAMRRRQRAAIRFA